MPETALTEQNLLEAAGRGDRAAFAEIVQKHQHAVFGYLRARMLDGTEAEDLCQEVFLRCYTQHTKFDRATGVRPWLLGIARNLLRENVRLVSRRKEVAWTEMCLELDSLMEVASEVGETNHDRLPACMQSLGTSARDAIDMRYRQGMRLAAIGELLQRSEGAVKLLMHRARLALKNCLDSKAGGASPNE